MQILVERINGTADVNDIVKLFDTSFVPELHTRVKNLGDYARKLNEYGELYVAKKEGTIIGFISYYMNDQITQTAYISLLAVLPEYRKNGVGEKLLSKMEEHARCEGFKKIGLEVDKNNNVAICFYSKHGAKFIREKSGETNYMEMLLSSTS